MKISIIMPAFNSERYIRASIESILNQSYQNIELIIIDDGSTDGTVEVIKSFSDIRIIYIYQTNKGVKRLAETLNVGLAIATGELVTMFPSDDLSEYKRFELQVKVFKDPLVVLVFGKMKLINEVDAEIGIFNIPQKIINLLLGPVDRLYESYLLENFIPQPTILLRKSILIEIGGYVQHHYMYAEDYPTQMEFVGRGKWVFIDEYLAKYRIHSGQMTKLHVMPMFRTDARYRLQLIRNLSNQKIDAFSRDRNELRREVIKNMYFGYYRLAKSYAKLGERRLAIKYFIKAIIKSNLINKIYKKFLY
jgi:glycosyltransferase involved in cell wall biosynthesis